MRQKVRRICLICKNYHDAHRIFKWLVLEAQRELRAQILTQIWCVSKFWKSDTDFPKSHVYLFGFWSFYFKVIVLEAQRELSVQILLGNSNLLLSIENFKFCCGNRNIWCGFVRILVFSFCIRLLFENEQLKMFKKHRDNFCKQPSDLLSHGEMPEMDSWQNSTSKW